MLQFKTQGFSGSSVAYSPFLDNRIAVAASANFGLVGNGRLVVVDIGPNAQLQEIRHFDTQDSAFSVAWSEQHANQAVVAGGDGAVRLFDVAIPEPLPLLVFRGHQREVLGVSWNLVDKSQFCSCSWDGSIKLWTPDSLQPLDTLVGPTPNPSTVYCARWAPHSPALLASAHGDSQFCIWDVRLPPLGRPPPIAGINGPGDCLTVDWNKYKPNIVATAGSDKIVRIWDLRQLGQGPLSIMAGHGLAVRSVKWSPHSPDYLLSASYDMTIKVWATQQAMGPPVPGAGLRGLVSEFTHHTEFVADADWSLWGVPGWAASVGWDQMLYLWKGF